VKIAIELSGTQAFNLSVPMNGLASNYNESIMELLSSHSERSNPLKTKVEASGTSLISVGAALTAIFDVLDPVFSYGKYLLAALAGILVYYAILAWYYETFEELTNNNRGWAKTHALHDFLEKNWRRDVLLTIGTLCVISAVGWYYTNQNKQDGGFIAAHSPEVRSIQQSLEKLLKGQAEIVTSIGDLEKQSDRIEKTTNTIDKNVQEIHQQTQLYSLTDLAKNARNSSNPYSYLRKSMQNLHFDMTYTPEDILYITNILSERKSDLLSTLAFKFLDTCEQSAYSEDAMLKILNGFSAGDTGIKNIIANKLDDIKFCLNEKPSKVMVEFFLRNESGRYSAIHFENSVIMRDLFNACSTPIDLNLFSDPNFLPVDSSYGLNLFNLHEIILMHAKKSVNCLTEESATFLNERYNAITLLEEGYYFQEKHIYSSKCDPEVTMSEVEESQRIGVRIRENTIRDATNNGCIRAS
jgi:hypothetical protein